uniref:Uncharacterized protein n=1 Tax=Tanacetum cinerariifolium TaxID=118510 RepID=A0A699GFT7_TANCI|nr:hypothetical protein [Tanacetum cinerariifolium]
MQDIEPGLASAPVRVQRDGWIGQVAIAVEADGAGHALVLDFRQLGQVLPGHGRAGRLHGLGQQHYRIVRIRCVGLQRQMVALLVAVHEFAVGDIVVAGDAAGHGAGELVVGQGLAGQLRQALGADTVAAEEAQVQAQRLHLLEHGAGHGVHAAKKDQVRLARLDLGEDGVEVGGAVVGVLAADGVRRRALRAHAFQKGVGQALAECGAVVDDGDAARLEHVHRVTAQHFAHLVVVGHQPERGLETLARVQRRGGGRRDLRDAGRRIDARGGHAGARVQMAHHAGHVGVHQFLRHGRALFGIAGIVLDLQHERDVAPAKLDALGVEVVDCHAGAVFNVLAHVGNRAGQRGNHADADLGHRLRLGLGVGAACGDKQKQEGMTHGGSRGGVVLLAREVLIMARTGFWAVEFRDPVCADCRAGGGAAHRSRRRGARVFRHLHGQAGRLRQAVLPGVPAGRRVRQADRDFRLFRIDRGGGHPLHRPHPRQRRDRAGVRAAHLRRGVAVRGGVCRVPVCRRALPPKQYPQAADAGGDCAGRVFLHHGHLARHAANPEHHSHHVFQNHGLGRAVARRGRQHCRAGRGAGVPGMAPAQRDGHRRRLWRQRRRQAGGGNRARRPAASAAVGGAAGARRRGQFRAHQDDSAVVRRQLCAHGRRLARPAQPHQPAHQGRDRHLGRGRRAVGRHRVRGRDRVRPRARRVCRRHQGGRGRRLAGGHEHGVGIRFRWRDRGAARFPGREQCPEKRARSAGQRGRVGDGAGRHHGLGVGRHEHCAGGHVRPVHPRGRGRAHTAGSDAPRGGHGQRRHGHLAAQRRRDHAAGGHGPHAPPVLWRDFRHYRDQDAGGVFRDRGVAALERNIAARADAPGVRQPVLFQHAFAFPSQKVEAVGARLRHQFAQLGGGHVAHGRQRMEADAEQHLVLDDIAHAGKNGLVEQGVAHQQVGPGAQFFQRQRRRPGIGHDVGAPVVFAVQIVRDGFHRAGIKVQRAAVVEEQAQARLGVLGLVDAVGAEHQQVDAQRAVAQAQYKMLAERAHIQHRLAGQRVHVHARLRVVAGAFGMVDGVAGKDGGLLAQDD